MTVKEPKPPDIAHLVPRFLYLYFVGLNKKEPKPPGIAYLVPRFLYLYFVGLNKQEPKPPDFSHRARKVLCWPRRFKLAHVFLWDYSYGRIKG